MTQTTTPEIISNVVVVGDQSNAPIFIVDQDECQEPSSPQQPPQPQPQQQQQQQPMVMETPIGSGHSRKKRSSFALNALTFVGILSSLSVVVFVLHSVGITKKSYVVKYKGGKNETLTTTTSPLHCWCQNLDGCRGESIVEQNRMEKKTAGIEVTCSAHQICGTLEDNRGVELIQGCIAESWKLCEFIYVNDFKAKKPIFGNQIDPHATKKSRNSTDNSHHHHRRPNHSSHSESYTVCYCRTHLCNAKDYCDCPKPSDEKK